MTNHPAKIGISQQSPPPVQALGDSAASAAPFHQVTEYDVRHCATANSQPDQLSVFHEYSTKHLLAAAGLDDDTKRC